MKPPKRRVEHGQTRRLGDLKPHPRNSRTHSPEQIAMIAASMGEWDWTAPMIIDDKNTILAGHGRQAAGIIRFGEDYQVPVSVVYGWSEEQKRAYVIADNKIAESADWDRGMLKAELTELRNEGFSLELTGFLDSELVSFLATPQSPDQFQAFGDDIETDHSCPRCGYKWSGKTS